MFSLLNKNKVNQVGIYAITVVLSAISINAHATLINYNVNNTELVYSSVSNVTWTKDANLLGTLISNSTDADGNGVKDVIEAIVAVGRVTNPTLSTGNFYGELSPSYPNWYGHATWRGAMAFVAYLNSINYGGSNRWYLPTVINTIEGYNTPTNGTAKGDELMELFYSELNGSVGNDIPDTPIFDNEQAYYYWSGSFYEPNQFYRWIFDSSRGLQGGSFGSGRVFVWAVSPGQVAAVPESQSVAMLLAGLVLVGGVVRRRQKLA